MIKFGGKSQFVLSKKDDRDFLNFIFLHLAIFFLIFSPHLPHLSNFSVNDLVGFSRGAATAHDFGNLILSDGVTNSAKTQTIPSGLIILSSLIPSLNNGDSGSTDGLLFAASIKDDAAAARSALTFNAGSDIELESLGSINIANNYTNSGGSIFLTATDNINNSNFQISAGENVVMQGNNVNNIATSNNSNETKIESGNIVSINAIKTACSGSDDGCSNGYKGGNITNIGATISGGSLVYLTADNNITNKALVEYDINGGLSYSSGLSSGQTAANFSNTTLDNDGISSSDTNVQSSSADHIESTLISQGNITSGGDLVLVAGNNLNNIGSNITSTGSSYLEATNGNINVTAIALRDRTVTSGGRRKNRWTQIVDNKTNLGSEISAGGDLDILSGANTSIIGSKVDAVGDLTANAGAHLIIANAVDSTFNQVESVKKGSVKTTKSMSSAYKETALESEVTAENINIDAGGTLLVQGSKMHSASDTNTNANDTIFQDAVLQEYNYAQRSTSFHGWAKAVTAMTSAAITLMNATLPGIVLRQAAIHSGSDSIKNGYEDATGQNSQFYNTKIKHLDSITSITSASTNISAGNNLTVTSSGDTTIQASNLSAGNQLTLNAENLNLLTRSETDIYSSETKTSRTMTFTNYNEGSVTTKDVINPSLSAGVDGSGNQKLTMNINDKVTAQFSAGDWNNVGSAPTDLAYLDDLKSQISPEKLTLQPIQFTEQSWNDANRGLTATGQVVIAVGITVATVASLGTAAPVTSGMAAGGWTAVGTSAGVAVASSAAATASVSATNASMNADGNFFGSLDDVGNTTIKDTTSSDSLRSYAIAGITAGAANWASDYFKIAEMGKAASAANTVDGTRTAAQVIQNLKVSLIESAISNGTSSVVQSIVNGDSTSDTLKHLAVNVGVGAVGNAAAKEIGNAAHGSITQNQDGTLTYHAPSIGKATQYALHAGLGAGVAVLTGNDAASGAVSGVVGEITAEYLGKNSNLNNNQIKELSGLSGGLSAIFTSNAVGLEDQQVADNIFSGQRIGKNAAENNSIQGKIMDEQVDLMWLDGKITDSEYQQYQQARNQNDRIAGEIALAGVTLGAGSGMIRGGLTLAESLLSEKGAKAAVDGMFGAVGATTTSYMEGERDFADLGKAAGIGFGVGVGASLIFRPRTALGIANVTGIGGLSESILSTASTNQNAEFSDYVISGAKGYTTGFISGVVAAPILIYGGNSLPVHLIAGQTGLGTGVATSAYLQILFPKSNSSVTSQSLPTTINNNH